MRKAELVLLCEDLQHATFLRRYLRRLGFNYRQFRLLPCPAGAGSGEQWVRERYPTEVRVQRRRAAHSTTASLIAMIDADTVTVDERRRQLDDGLEVDGQGRRAEPERIAVVVPRRNIESWIHFTRTDEVDEHTDYKPRYRDDADGCREAALRALEVCRQASGSTGSEPSAPASLLVACGELQRVTRSM